MCPAFAVKTVFRYWKYLKFQQRYVFSTKKILELLRSVAELF